jgi:hypothetical protein
VAALTLDLRGLLTIAAMVVASFAESLFQIAFGDSLIAGFGLIFRDETTERTGENLLAGVPFQFPGAVRTGTLS